MLVRFTILNILALQWDVKYQISANFSFSLSLQPPLHQLSCHLVSYYLVDKMENILQSLGWLDLCCYIYYTTTVYNLPSTDQY